MCKTPVQPKQCRSEGWPACSTHDKEETQGVDNDNNEKVDKTTINKETMANKECLVNAADCCIGDFQSWRSLSTTSFSDKECKQTC